jgi:hypothetical protein
MGYAGEVTVDRRGRSGRVRVDLGGRELLFDWEFGGGDCIAFVVAPDPQEWQSLEPHRTLERESFRAWLAAELAARECPGARIEVGPSGIHFFERPAEGAGSRFAAADRRASPSSNAAMPSTRRPSSRS